MQGEKWRACVPAPDPCSPLSLCPGVVLLVPGILQNGSHPCHCWSVRERGGSQCMLTQCDPPCQGSRLTLFYNWGSGGPSWVSGGHLLPSGPLQPTGLSRQHLLKLSSHAATAHLEVGEGRSPSPRDMLHWVGHPMNTRTRAIRPTSLLFGWATTCTLDGLSFQHTAVKKVSLWRVRRLWKRTHSLSALHTKRFGEDEPLGMYSFRCHKKWSDWLSPQARYLPISPRST